MELPTITGEDIRHFHKLSEDFKATQALASRAIADAKLNQNNELTIARDGKPVSIREKDLWDEVWTLGATCEAAGILKEKYPDVFIHSVAADDKRQEIKVFAIERWQVDPLAISLSDIIRIIEGVVDYKKK